MGEIKSTLELVMERTKHLSLSGEEKRDQRQEEIRTKVRSLVQKYRDRTIKKHRLEGEIRVLRKDYAEEENIILTAIIDNLSLDEDNTPIFALLQAPFNRNIQGINTLCKNYQAAVETAKQKRAEDLKQYLREKYSIEGTAVIPCFAFDREWQTQVQSLRSRYTRQLAEEKTALIAE
ncbi:MAG: hypothetical protein JXD19_12740 [Deltaproteobacteria bacterium]|nr:hypothetical protein [Deltaproteobacteria bacterium]